MDLGYVSKPTRNFYRYPYLSICQYTMMKIEKNRSVSSRKINLVHEPNDDIFDNGAI